MQESPWATPSPATEAKSMFDLARLIGTDRVRHLIVISDEEKSELRAWAAENPLIADKIEDCIEFRQKVLILFNALVEREAEKNERAA